MKTYMVWVRSTNDGRYLDSQWAKEETAQARRLELIESMTASGSRLRHEVDIHIGEVADVCVKQDD